VKPLFYYTYALGVEHSTTKDFPPKLVEKVFNS